MDRDLRTSGNLVMKPREFFEKAISKGYPVAFWRMPGENRVLGLVDLSSEAIKNEEKLEEMNAGFAVNPFLQHHPSTPAFIKADILLQWDDEKNVEVSYDPMVTGEAIDRFYSEENRTGKQIPHTFGTSGLDYQESVADAVSSIKLHQLDKVVISRYDDRNLPESFDVYNTFISACQSYPNAFAYSLFTPEHGLWMGATPESLLSLREGHHFETVSLAGTQILTDDQTLNDVAWTQKEIEEQAMVSRYVIECFKKIRLREFIENGPKTVRAGNLAHLKTTYKVDTRNIEIQDLSSIMMNLLHPTSAVCGMPLRPALEFIKSHETFDRELFTGFLGPVNIHQSTDLFVNLRCVKIAEKNIRFYAGAGITEDSDPEKEYQETELKMQTMKRLIFP